MRLASAAAIAVTAIAVLALSGSGIAPASAHSIPLKNWCGTNSGGPITVHQFDLTGPELQVLVNKTIDSIQMANDAEDAGLDMDPDNDGKCGIVDIDLLHGSGLRASSLRTSDEWTQATVAITLYCNQFQVQGYDVSMPYIPGGTPYTAGTHHATYRISYGLKGSCLACPMREAPDIGT